MLRVVGVYALIAAAIFFAAAGGLVEASRVIGLNAHSIVAAILLGPLAALVWALNEPLRADHTGWYMFGLFSLVVLPLLAFARAASPPSVIRSGTATVTWVSAGLLTYAVAHFVA